MAQGGITITSQDRGPIINVISWILIVLTCLATLAKIWSKWTLTKRLQADDYYLTGATLTALGWVIAVSKQVNAGLGSHQSSMSADQVVLFQQAAYSSQLLYVVSLCLAKMAILHFMLTLARIESRRRAVQGTLVFNLVSTIVGVFAVAFQCPLPHPWTILSPQCINQTSFWIAFGVMDIVVDVATVVLPFFLLHDLRTTWKRKLPAIIAFALRFLILPMIIVRLVFLKLNTASTDHPYDDFSAALTTSVHISLSVIITCLPFLKTVMDNLQTGLLAGDLRIRSPSRLYGYRTGREGHNMSNGLGIMSTKRSTKHDQGYVASVSNKINGERSGTAQSGASNERMVINQTTTISLESERREFDTSK